MPTPRKIFCFVCGEELEIRNRVMDSDGDITLDIVPCPDCIKEAGDKECEEETE